MPHAAQAGQVKVLVIPRQLEGFFYERLTQRYAGRDDVAVVVDRRVGERRRERWVSGPGALSERRRGDRRDRSAEWTLADMPFLTPAS